MNAGHVSLWQHFELARGQSAAVEALEVRMEGVIKDERCPMDVECVHPGDATVVIGIRWLPAGAWATYPLHTGGHQLDQQVTWETYVVELLGLEPERRWGRPAPRNYRAELRVGLTWAARLRRGVELAQQGLQKRLRRASPSLRRSSATRPPPGRAAG